MKKLFLDDERKPHKSWELVECEVDCINALKKDWYEIVSLDHDLGPSGYGTGYGVICWIEEQVHTNPEFVPPSQIWIHTGNPSAGLKMYEAAKKIMEKCPEVQSTIRHSDSGWWRNENGYEPCDRRFYE